MLSCSCQRAENGPGGQEIPGPFFCVRTFSILLLTLLLALPLGARTRAVHSPGLEPIEHVFIVILENEDPGVADDQPFFSRLAAHGARLDRYYSITHPSQPNYIALTAGTTWSTTNAIVTLDVAHIGDLLEKAGRTWRVYAENYPGNCWLGTNTPDHLYVRRHVPFISFENVQKNPERCNSSIVNATQLDADIAAGSLPSYAMYIPNNRHNGHDTSASYADAWLESRFAPLLRDIRFTRNTLFIVTYDESAPANPNLRVATVLWGAGVIPGVSMRRYDHYSLLRTVEELFGTGTLGQRDARAEPIADVRAIPE